MAFSYPGTEYFRWGVRGADDARAKTLKLAQAGVDCIKLIDQDEMMLAEIQAIVDEAHRNRLPVVAHAHRPEEIRRGSGDFLACSRNEGGTGRGYRDGHYRGARRCSAVNRFVAEREPGDQARCALQVNARRRGQTPSASALQLLQAVAQTLLASAFFRR